MTGSQISHYRIRQKLGAGGMGVVYQAEDLKLERLVALKFLSAHMVADPESRQRFLREARSVAALSHPNICTIYEVDEVDGKLFIAMEYCEGMPLREMIRSGPLELPVALSLVSQVADAISEAHRKQVVHRDVKSSNIMVDPKNRAKLLDFGLASLDISSETTQTMSHMGTPAYMSPERFETSIADARGDIWALGVVLYEVVTGQVPFAGEKRRLIHSILNEYPPPISSLRVGLPLELDEIVDKALAKEPEERYQNADDFAADLKVMLRQLPQTGESGIRSAGETRGASTIESHVSRAGSFAGQLSFANERVHAMAVLPFANLSQNRDDDFLSDGLTEEIINALTQVRGLRVVSRVSAFRFRSPELDLREVGRRLRVGALLLGSVRRQENRIRVSAQLVKTSDSYQIWSRRFDCEVKSIFDLEDELTMAIVESLRERLGTDLEMAPSRGHTTNFDAHEFYLRARHAFNRHTAQGVQDALRFFSQALEFAPRYALAHVGMADCYALQGWYGFESPEKVLPLAKAELETAILIEDALPSAWCLRGAITAGFDWNWDRARLQFQKAFSLAPVTSDLYFHHALDFLTPQLRLEEALEEIRMALEIDPVAPLVNTALGGCYYRLRRYSAALQQLQVTLELDPAFYHAHWSMGRVQQSMGKHREAIACFEKATAGSGDNPALMADTGHCHAMMGDSGAARQVLERVAGLPLPQAIVHLGLGEKDAVLDNLTQAVKHRTRGLIWLGVDPRFDEIRQEAAFREIMAPVGLPDGKQ